MTDGREIPSYKGKGITCPGTDDVNAVRNSLHKEIERRNQSFQSLRKAYFDTSAAARLHIYQHLQSDSSDQAELEKHKHSPAYELLADLQSKMRQAVQSSPFYQTQEAFEKYLQSRSFRVTDDQLLEKIFNREEISRKDLEENHHVLQNETNINFIILFSVSYASAYSEQAGVRIGSETTILACYSVPENKIISEASVTQFMSNDSGDEKIQ